MLFVGDGTHDMADGRHSVANCRDAPLNFAAALVQNITFEMVNTLKFYFGHFNREMDQI